MRRMTFFTAVALTVLIAPAAEAQVAAPVVNAPLEGTRLDIVATGESRQAPDIVVINAGVVTEAATAQEALAANNREMQSVFAALRSAGIAERDIQTASINLNPRYDYENRTTPELVGYTASNQLTLRFRDIEQAGPIIDALVAQGVNQINGPSLEIDEPEAALNEARRDALQKARSRADVYASALGMRVVRVVAVSEGAQNGFPVPMPVARMAADTAESMRIAPGEQELSATVTVTYLLQ